MQTQLSHTSQCAPSGTVSDMICAGAASCPCVSFRESDCPRGASHDNVLSPWGGSVGLVLMLNVKSAL